MQTVCCVPLCINLHIRKQNKKGKYSAGKGRKQNSGLELRIKEVNHGRCALYVYFFCAWDFLKINSLPYH